MFLKKNSRKDFTGFVKAMQVETRLLKEMNKFLEKATNLDPLKKWYGKKFWLSSPTGLLIEAEISQINIQIDKDWVHIQWYGTDGNTYNDFAFFDKDEAKDVAEMVAGTYIEKLKKDKEFYKGMIQKTEDAIAYAKLPDEERVKEMKRQQEELQKQLVLDSKEDIKWPQKKTTKKKSKTKEQSKSECM